MDLKKMSLSELEQLQTEIQNTILTKTDTDAKVLAEKIQAVLNEIDEMEYSGEVTINVPVKFKFTIDRYETHDVLGCLAYGNENDLYKPNVSATTTMRGLSHEAKELVTDSLNRLCDDACFEIIRYLDRDAYKKLKKCADKLSKLDDEYVNLDHNARTIVDNLLE